MKRRIRLFVLVIAAVLLAAATVIGASAASTVTSGGFRYTSGGVEKTTASMTFGEVVAAADAGSTVTMLGNYTEESSINGYIATVDKELTLDMGGYTFTIRNRYDNATDYGQPRIAVKTSEGFTVKNGTVVAGHIQNTYKTRAYPFFQFTEDNAVLNLENVNSYLSTLFYSYGNKGMKVNITGGEHHSILSAYGCDGGLFNTRASVDVRVSDARFYIASTSWLITSLHQNDNGEAKATSYTFTGCDILTANTQTELIKYASEYTTARFYGCNFLGGKITSPTVNQKDTDKGIGAAKDGSIILGADTAWHEGFAYGAVVTHEAIAIPSTLSKTVTVSYSFSSGNLCDGFSIAAPKSSSYTLPYGLVSAASTVTSGGFRYTSGGVQKTTDSMTFGEVVAAADAGSTVTMLGNYTEESSINGHIATVDKALTLDMGGYAFTIRNRYDNATDYGQPRIAVKTSEGFTVKNGTVVAGHIQSTYKAKAYPFFQFVADNAVLNLENVNSYLSTLFYSYGNKGIKVNITGGEHHSILSGYGCDGGFFDSRASVNVTATDARFYIASASWLITSLHQNDNGAAKATSYTFTGCDILTANADTELIKYASEYTTVRFYGCNILGGRITSPTVNQKDTDKGIGAAKDGSIILGVGTAWYDGFVYDSAVAREEGTLLSMLGRTATVCYSFSSGNLCDGLVIAPSDEREYKLAYSLVDEASGELINVSWYDEDGDLIGLTSHVAGIEITPPALAEYREENNGWYTRVYDGWSRTVGGAPEQVVYSAEDTAFYLTRGTVKAGLKNSKFNLSLMGHVQINLYIPMGMPQGISFLGAYESAAGADVGTGELPSGDIITLSSSRYMCYTAGYAGATSLGDTTTVYVKYKVSVDGTETTLVQPITLSALAYVKAIFADYEAQTHAYPASVYEMVANIVRYSYNLTRFIGATADAEIEALYDTYVDTLCNKISPSKDTTFPSPTVSVGSLADYMYSIAFEVGSYQPRFRMVFREGSGVTDMKISLVGWYAGRQGEANWREQTFSYNSTYGILYYDSQGQYVNTSGVVCDVEGNPIEGATAGGVTSDIAVLYSDNIQVYNIDSDMTITLTTPEGEVSGQYNLNAYYHGIKDSLTLSKLYNVRKVLMTVREYGESVVRYRFAGGKVTEDTNVETPTVTYSDFGAAGDGITNDFYAIKATHDYANSHGYKVLGEEGKTYYIGMTGGQTVTVKTDTDWCGARFIIDDTKITVEMKERDMSIFTLANDTPSVTYTPSSSGSVGAALTAINAAGGIKRDSFERLELGLGYPALVHLVNAEHSSYIRYGLNEDAGSAQRELVLLDKDGNVDPSTPLLFDYDKITSVIVIRTDCTPITVGNGELTTVANTAERLYNYYGRNISVNRPNTTITGISHKIVGEGDTGAPYSGFITVGNANNVVIRDSVLSAHKAYKLLTDANNTMGTYDLSFGNSNAITCTGVTMHNFFAPGTETPSVFAGYWGIMGSNYCKNLVYDGCKLTRFDAHCGTYNATIRNSDVATLTLIGGGRLTIEDTNVYTHNSSNLVTLRGDYGSTWNGEFCLKNVTAVTSSTYKGATFALISGDFTNWNFGYKCYMPESVTVDNFKLSAASVKTVTLASGSITSAGIGEETYRGVKNLNPYEVTKIFTVRNNTAGYTYTLPAAFTETELVIE